MHQQNQLIYLITLNWNRGQETLDCLHSLQGLSYPHRRIVVVDNGSTDDSVTLIQTQFPEIKLIGTGHNLGFAAGFNVGIRYALSHEAEHIFLLNNDTVVDTTLLDDLLQHAAPEVGVLAPAIFYADAPDRIWSTGGGRHPLLLEMTGHHGRNQALPCAPVEREFLSGCALLIRREVFERVGLLDERFFMYYEDSDFCLRVRQVGFRLLLVPQARLWHKVSISSGGADSPAERYLMARSSVLFFTKH
ncbi:MAG: glycosyltransferase family 2 protein, partial [Chloroflexi bacterium]|nr:glycosyltransferase family 2 protein [Chloroflexota bacterium]